MRRLLHAYALMVRNSVIREMNFKANFLLWLAVELLWFGVQIAFISVLFAQVDAIAGWSKWEVVLLVGTHQIASQIFQAFCFSNISELPELIRTGRLDFQLLLPMDGQFLVSFRRFGIDSLVNAGVGVAIVAFALERLGLTPTPAQVALYAAAVAVAVTIHYAVMFGLALISFWTIRAQGMMYGYYSLFNLARYPREVFRGAARFAFTWVLPVLLVANVPAAVLAGRLARPWEGLAQLAAAAAIVLAAIRALWKIALRRYSSASS